MGYLVVNTLGGMHMSNFTLDSEPIFVVYVELYTSSCTKRGGGAVLASVTSISGDFPRSVFKSHHVIDEPITELEAQYSSLIRWLKDAFVTARYPLSGIYLHLLVDNRVIYEHLVGGVDEESIPAGIIELRDEARRLLESFDEVEIECIDRDENPAYHLARAKALIADLEDELLPDDVDW